MKSATDLQKAVAKLLETPGALSIPAPVVRRREKDVVNDMGAGLAVQKGLCFFAMRPFPTHVLENTPFVFCDGYEMRIRIIEVPSLNSTGVDTFDLIDDVMLALHWKIIDGLLAYPLQLKNPPVEMVEGTMSVPGFEKREEFVRIVDVIFDAKLQINPEPTN